MSLWKSALFFGTHLATAAVAAAYTWSRHNGRGKPSESAAQEQALDSCTQTLLQTAPKLASAGLLYSTPRFEEAVAYVQDHMEEVRGLLTNLVAHLEKPLGPSDAVWMLALDALAASDDVMEAAGLKSSALYQQVWRCLLRLTQALHTGQWKAATYLADVLLLQGEYSEAGALFAQALDLCEADAPLGRRANSVEAATVLVKWAWCNRVTGKYDEAQRCYSEAQSIFEGALGPGSALALLAANGVANVLCHRKDFEKAEQLHRSVLAGRRSTLGAKHPETATSLNNLGNVVEYQGRWEEARALYQAAYEIRAAGLGASHADTLNSLISWMTALEELGKSDEAEEIRQAKWPQDL